jgi:3-methyladenine DNA glycosylase AlkD
MTLSPKAKKLYNQITSDGTKLGDLRTLAKEIKKDHDLAKELWSTGEFLPRLMAILIMDKKELNEDVVDLLFEDIEGHTLDERTQLADWLMANQLTKDKKTVALMESWENSPSAIQRRMYWYYQGRLRWTGQTPPDNTQSLLAGIEQKILNEEPEVQWAMNFTAGWIGVFDEPYRNQCIRMGERLGLYKDEIVPRNCTPNYLPKFIEIEAGKRKL